MVAVSEYVPYRIHTINIFLGQGYALHIFFCIKTTKVQLRRRRTSEIHAQVIQGTFPSEISMLRIVWIRRSLVSSNATHLRCSPTSSLNHCKGQFFDVSVKSSWDGRTSTSCKIMSYLQRRSALEIMSLETNQKPRRRQLTSRS